MLLALADKATAQPCGPRQNVQWDYANLEPSQGFINSNILPCLLQGQANEMVVPFFCPEVLGGDSVYAMRINAITNLPCGLCWYNGSDSVFTRGVPGCIVVSGTTTDNLGQYLLNVTVSIDTDGDGTFNQSNVPLATLVSTPQLPYLRIIGPDDVCTGINYSGTNKTATPTCN